MSDNKQTRNRLFGRNYDYDSGVLSISIDGADEKPAIKFADLPGNVQTALGMQALADLVTYPANESYREDGNKDAAIAVLKAAIADALAGKVEFRSGVGLGLSSAPATRLVGRALVECGKSFVVFKGQKLTFSTEQEAQDVMAKLYADTSENNVDAHKRTGRQFFNIVADIPEIAAKVRSYRKAKAIPTGVELG